MLAAKELRRMQLPPTRVWIADEFAGCYQCDPKGYEHHQSPLAAAVLLFMTMGSHPKDYFQCTWPP